MLKKMSVILIALLLVGAPLALQATNCPDYGVLENPPGLSGPSKKSFRRWGNWLLSKLYNPYHMIHDGLAKVGDSVSIVGKFDYDLLLHKDLEGENIHAYIYGTGMNGWEYLGVYRTNGDGKVYVPVGARPTGEYMIKMVVEGDLSSATGYLTVVDPGLETVLFDIDGTITLSDFEGVGDYLGISTARTHAYAVETVNAYRQKGYQIIFLTGRPYWLARTTRQWMGEKNLPQWHLHTNPYGDGPAPPNTESYKTEYISYLIDTAELNIIRAYGNADTDVSSYAYGGIPVDETYIIGENAGMGGTNPLGNDYEEHFDTIVANTPQSSCTP